MFLKLEIIHLQMIREVADAGTITKAAERLCITQSALSRRISEAERRLDTALFQKKNKKLFLTDAGQRLLFSADKILKELAIAENDINVRSSISKEVVTVGMPAYGCYDWLPETLKRTNIRNSVDKIDINLKVMDQPLLALQEGEVDLAFITEMENENDFNITTLFTDKLVAVLPKEHSLANKIKLGTQDFSNEVYFAHEAGINVGSEYDRFFNDRALSPEKTIHIGLIGAIVELVSNGIGVSILPYRSVKPYLDKNDITVLPLTGPGVNIEWYAVSKIGNEQVKSMELERIIRDVNAEILEKQQH